MPKVLYSLINLVFRKMLVSICCPIRKELKSSLTLSSSFFSKHDCIYFFQTILPLYVIF
ncbi:hypothetical protein SAMN05518684_11521 [Salipaludibacillus aurantiacus]|uniref:Uncharacterized protein n=1 Tax=Salipaludibacillus aurantiacus TaxID=1601833 RepID=A0A1H9W8L5_9BACI|nr:hypothetical protein SAMN05518684_11521 [Salipaludibacillus aurantiacus]